MFFEEYHGKHQLGDRGSQQHLNKAQILKKLFTSHHKKEGNVKADMETDISMKEDLETMLTITRNKLNDIHKGNKNLNHHIYSLNDTSFRSINFITFLCVFFCTVETVKPMQV